MFKLQTPLEAVDWLRQRVTGTLQTDSRRVCPGDGFIAWPGSANDARQHVAAALNSGATACLVAWEDAEPYAFSDERIAGLCQLQSACGPIAAAYFDHPGDALAMLAVTGTNGKTSTAWWLAQALSQLKQATPIPCGLIGTLGMGQVPAPGAQQPLEATGLTTPDPVSLQRTLRHFVGVGLRACALEASSIGLQEQRLAGTPVHTAIFTNFTQDHLDYHASMAAYWQAKAQLFQWPGLRSAVINIDDVQGAAMAHELVGKVPDLWTVSCRAPARLQAQAIGYDAQGLYFTVQEASATGEQQHMLHTGLTGSFNVANLLGVMAAMRSLGVPLAVAVAACADLTPVPGRMACIGQPDQPLAVVDYAHTPDALGKALAALRTLADQRGGQLWCVFGCGGNRDAGKRPLMGAMAARHADRVVVTSDNPRFEKSEHIICQILLGLTGHASLVVQPDRALAISQALAQASSRDVLMIAGKGHEAYQEVAGQCLPFSDEEQVRRALAIWGGVHVATDRDEIMTLGQIQPWLPDATLVGSADVRFQRVHSDTRTIQPGDLFVALQGEHFDANDFLAEAKAKGAVAALCQGDAQDRLLAVGLPGLLVTDTRLALGQLATYWRAQFRLPLIAVTGSNGKTTVTQMIAAILRSHQPQAFLATQGNFNNDIGVPLTLLRLRRYHVLAVVELGMNHPGEIATLAAMARPTVALVNNAQREHLEFMATVEAVAEENGAVIEALADDGVAVFPDDDDFSALWLDQAGARTLSQFSLGDDPASLADVRCEAALWLGDAWQVSVSTRLGPLHYQLHIAGRHNVKNSLAAVACALAAGVPLAAIAAGLSAFEPVKGRSRALLLPQGEHSLTLVDDTYNANPDSVQAAIQVLAALPGPRLLVLGDMGEVGDQGPQFHREAGALARSLGIEQLFTLGELSAISASSFGEGRHFEDQPALIAAVLAALPEVTSVLVKGSRFMKMERVVEAMTAQVQQNKKENHVV
jgi:murE/murF fusion protein